MIGMGDRSDMNAHSRFMYDEQYSIALKFGTVRGFRCKKGCSVCQVERQWILNRRRSKDNETAIFALPWLSSHKHLTGQ